MASADQFFEQLLNLEIKIEQHVLVVLRLEQFESDLF